MQEKENNQIHPFFRPVIQALFYTPYRTFSADNDNDKKTGNNEKECADYVKY